jgi:hypothetical protein
VLATTLSLRLAGDVPLNRDPRERLRVLLRQEVDRLARDPRQVRVFLEYWALGTRSSVIRTKVRTQLESYRAAFRTLVDEVLRTEPGRFAGVTPDGLAAVVVSLIHGCAVQAMIDPDRFDVGDYLAAVQGIVGQLAMAA